MRERWKGWLVRLGTLALFAALGFSFYLTLGMAVERPVGTNGTRNVLREDEICAELAISQLSPGCDLVRAGRIVTRRMRKGPILTAAKEMLISDLYLCLPASYFQSPAAANGASADAPAAVGGAVPQNAEGAMDALVRGGGRMRELLPRVAGVLIRNLRIDRQEGTNAVPWIEAQGARLGERAMQLVGPVVSSNGVRRAYSEGMLEYRPCLRVYGLH